MAVRGNVVEDVLRRVVDDLDEILDDLDDDLDDLEEDLDEDSGVARLEELRREAAATPPPPMDVDSTTDRVQHLEAMVAELRRERDDLRAAGAVPKRGSVPTVEPKDPIPDSLDELPQWITSTSARLSLAVQREDVVLVAELSSQIAAGGLKLASAKRRCNMGSAIAVVK